MNGIINLDKPAGLTSAAAVRRVKNLLPRGTRIGHAGTLDPFATGVLLLLIGSATRLSQSLMNLPKAYQTTVRLGANTETDDLESPGIPVAGAAAPSLAQIQEAIKQFIGTVPQRPPRFSAMKVGGQRAYKLARQNRPVELSPRNVRIDDIQIIHWEWPLLKLRIDCGRGTYIRALARDLGEKLNTGGYLTELRRLRIGQFTTEQAVSLDQLLRDGPARYVQQG